MTQLGGKGALRSNDRKIQNTAPKPSRRAKICDQQQTDEISGLGGQNKTSKKTQLPKASLGCWKGCVKLKLMNVKMGSFHIGALRVSPTAPNCSFSRMRLLYSRIARPNSLNWIQQENLGLKHIFRIMIRFRADSVKSGRK